MPAFEVLAQLLAVHGSMESLAGHFPGPRLAQTKASAKIVNQRKSVLLTATRFKRESFVQGGAPGLPKRKAIKVR